MPDKPRFARAAQRQSQDEATQTAMVAASSVAPGDFIAFSESPGYREVLSVETTQEHVRIGGAGIQLLVKPDHEVRKLLSPPEEA